jgi:hypothetical protein
MTCVGNQGNMNIKPIKKLIDTLGLEQLRSVKEYISDKITHLEREISSAKENQVYDEALQAWFTLAKEKLRNTHSHKVALSKTFSKLDAKYKWTHRVIKSDHHDIPCTTEECWYKNNIDRFYGVTELEVSIFVDVNEGDTMMLCDVCCDNGEQEMFDVDVGHYVGEFEEWLTHKKKTKSAVLH